MTIRFFKFQANGNDFILIDNRGNGFQANRETVARLCHRQLGIGADGLMLLDMSGDYDFEMHYFNSDGSFGEMCGNGGRSIAAMAYMQGIAGRKMRFAAGDGIHEAQVKGADTTGRVFDISLKMQNVQEIQPQEEGFFLNTGVPHLVQFVPDIEAVDVAASGRKLRNDGRFAPEGTNVDFVEVREDSLFVRTYERGVERETLSCGTGVTASVLAASLKTGREIYSVHTPGGDFQVHFRKAGNSFEDIWLRGPAEWVFQGEISV